MTPPNILDLPTRKEIANEIWRVFALLASSTNIAFDGSGVTIRIYFKEKHQLDGPPVIYAKITGYQQYEENTTDGYTV